MLNKVRAVGYTIKNDRTVPSIFNATVEEIGELAKEIRVKYQPDCYKKGDEDGIAGEAVDVLITIFDILAKEGYTQTYIEGLMDKKLAKWKEKAGVK